MAINQPGATFVSRGVKYVLGYGPKGNLRPYTVGPVTTGGKRVLSTGNPYVIAATAIVVTAGIIGYYVWKKYR